MLKLLADVLMWESRVLDSVPDRGPQASCLHNCFLLFIASRVSELPDSLPFLPPTTCTPAVGATAGCPAASSQGVSLSPWDEHYLHL